MSLAVIGISHHTAPIEVRERFAFSPAEIPSTLGHVLEDDGIAEAALLSTCNRTELYLHLAGPDQSLVHAIDVLRLKAGPLPRNPESYLSTRREIEVVRHLFRVSAGLDSMMLGEVQIQGQVREAYELARGLSAERQAVRAVFNRLFQTALSVGGRVRTQTQLSEGAASVPSAGVELAKKIFGSLRGHTGIVLGAGEMGELTARTLADAGLSRLFVASRDRERAERLTAAVGGTAIEYSRFWSRMPEVDILITSTSAPHPVVTLEECRRALGASAGKPLLIVDISVPRDVDPEIGRLPNVFLYSIDDLEQIVELNTERRRGEIPPAERIIEAAADEFWRWRNGLRAVPLIREMRERAEAIRRAELDRALASFAEMSERERESLDRMTRSMLNRLLHEPTSRLRKAAENGADLDVMAAVLYLIGSGEDGQGKGA